MKTSALLCAAGFAAVLPWTAIAQTNLNRTPSRVVGHPTLNLRSSNPNVVEGRSLYSPWAVVVDTTSTPNAIFVSDTFNNRVLGWRDAVTFQSGARADLILGQLDDQSTERLGPNNNASRNLGFTTPGALAIDSKGSLYILDSGNNRILRFPKPFGSDAEPRLPDMVIGQPGYTSGAANSGGVSDSSIAVSSGANLGISGLAFDPQGNLWFSDPLNHRVLRYPKAALDAGANRPAADLVLGQPDFRTSAAPSGSNLRLNKAVLTNPSGIGIDNEGRVYVSDANARVLVFSPPFTNGKEASRIVGVWLQPPNTPFTAFDYVLTGPEGISIMNNRLVVYDTPTSRILRYDPFLDWPAETETIISPQAKAILGQSDFSGDRPNRSLPEPNGTTVSRPVSGFPVGNDLYVADTGNNRVLVFPSFGPTATATRVLGQTDFSRNSANIVEGRELWTFNGFSALIPGVSLADGGGVVIDSYSNPPRLYIADSYNNRILGYKDARLVRPNDPADIVIGQNDLTRTLVNAPQGNAEVQTDSGLFRPTGLAIDSNGDLFVADTGNGRVLRFPSPFEQTVGTGERRRANLVIGQRNFGEKFTDASRFNMGAPFGVAITVERHLVVSDAAHNRVLFFRRPAGADFTNGMAAERVFGQPDFNSTARVVASNRMYSPRHIALDTDDRLYVADAGNNRILIFDRVTSAPNDPPAATPITGLQGVQSVWVSPGTGEIWAAATRANEAQRFPRFDQLSLGISSNYQIPVQTPLAITQDAFGNLYVVEATNRVSIYYNGLASQIAGNYAVKPLSPGGIGIVYPQTQSSTFSSDTKVAGSQPLPKELSDIEVLLNERAVPLYFVSPGQINFLVPYDMPESGTAELQVVRKSLGQILGASTVNLARVSPALFTADVSNPAGQLAAINVQDGSVNSPSNPVARGQYISLYGTGMGPVENPPADGSAAPGATRGVEFIRVLVGTQYVPAENIQYFGLAPGFVGLYQINVLIPTVNVAPGADVDVVVEVRSALTNRTGTPERIIRTTIAVKAN